MITIKLSFPSSKLSPNARIHWAQRAKEVKLYRQAAWAEALSQNDRALFPLKGYSRANRLSVKFTINPPDNRRRDDDNMIGACKSSRDGIADAIGVDDAFWRTTYLEGDVIKGGAVVVEIDI